MAGDMSLFSAESVKEYANTLGIKDLGDEAAAVLANDVEYRLREVIQDAAKFMRHGYRERMKIDDVKSAFRMKNIEPIYGYDPACSFSFVGMSVKKNEAEKTVFYIPEKSVKLLDVLNTPPEPLPLAEAVSAHWMAVEGVAPRIVENVVEEAPSDAALARPFDKDDVREAALKKPLIQHCLSKEMVLYFDTVEDCLLAEGGARSQAALDAVQNDAGIQQLVPYFTQLIADLVTKNLRTLHILRNALLLARSPLSNPHLCIEPYLHQLLPPVLTCALGKSLCSDVEKEDHWSLRERAAELAASLCHKYANSYQTLQPRVVKTFLRVFTDQTRPLPAHYGCVYGIYCLGMPAVDSILLPNMKQYMGWLSESGATESPFKVPLVSLLKKIFAEWKAGYASPTDLRVQELSPLFE